MPVFECAASITRIAVFPRNLMRYIGTAGWSIPSNTSKEPGTRLERYSSMLACVEINSTFYRAHRATTWQRWAAETPAGFKFSIKAPRTITHDSNLMGVQTLLTEFLNQIEPLREKAGPLLFQLPPSLEFDPAVAEDFLASLRSLFQGEVALEPRHASWFAGEVDSLVRKHRISRIAVDPPKGGPRAATPGGDLSLIYYRLHGSPRTYYSRYSEEFLISLRDRISDAQNAWIIFDNTALGHAYENALHLRNLMG